MPMPSRVQERFQLSLGTTGGVAEEMWSKFLPTTEMQAETDDTQEQAECLTGEVAQNESQMGLDIAGVPENCAAMLKTRAVIDRVHMTLKDFTTDACFDMKEKPLTPCLKHVLVVQHEVVNSPCANHLLVHLKPLVETMDAAKKLPKPLVMYYESSNPEKLSEIFEFSAPVVDFLEGRSERLGPVAMAIVWRSRVADVQGSAPKVTQLVLKSWKETLPALFLEKAKGDQLKVEELSLELVFDTLCNCLRARLTHVTPDKCDSDLKKVLLGDTDAYSELLLELPLVTKLDISEHRRLFICMSLILRASLAEASAVEVPSPLELNDAFATMRSDDKARKMRNLMMESSVGQVIVIDAELLLAANALGEQADVDFKTGDELLAVDGMPQITRANIIERDISLVRGSSKLVSTQAQALAQQFEVMATFIIFAAGCIVYDTTEQIGELFVGFEESMVGWDGSSLPFLAPALALRSELRGKEAGDFAKIAQTMDFIDEHLVWAESLGSKHTLLWRRRCRR